MSPKASFIFSSAAMISLVASCVAVAQEPKQESRDFRTWTDSTGASKVEAHFELFEDGKVHLRRKDNYQWTGYVEGNTLFGKYRSASGNNGEFRLTKPTG